ELGVVMSGEGVAASKRYGAAVIRVHAALQGLKIAIVEPLIDTFTQSKEALAAWVVEHRKLIAELAHKAFFTFLDGMKWLVRTLQATWRIVKATVDVVAALVGWFYRAGPIVGTLLTAVAGLTTAMALFGVASTAAAIRAAAAWALAALPVLALA